ncbi:MAG: Putative TonB-dependent receptor, partial [uncultured Gemmatimonadetes bacterium]
ETRHNHRARPGGGSRRFRGRPAHAGPGRSPGPPGGGPDPRVRGGRHHRPAHPLRHRRDPQRRRFLARHRDADGRGRHDPRGRAAAGALPAARERAGPHAGHPRRHRHHPRRPAGGGGDDPARRLRGGAGGADGDGRAARGVAGPGPQHLLAARHARRGRRQRRRRPAQRALRGGGHRRQGEPARQRERGGADQRPPVAHARRAARRLPGAAPGQHGGPGGGDPQSLRQVRPGRHGGDRERGAAPEHGAGAERRRHGGRRVHRAGERVRQPGLPEGAADAVRQLRLHARRPGDDGLHLPREPLPHPAHLPGAGHPRRHRAHLAHAQHQRRAQAGGARRGVDQPAAEHPRRGPQRRQPVPRAGPGARAGGLPRPPRGRGGERARAGLRAGLPAHHPPAPERVRRGAALQPRQRGRAHPLQRAGAAAGRQRGGGPPLPGNAGQRRAHPHLDAHGRLHAPPGRAGAAGDGLPRHAAPAGERLRRVALLPRRRRVPDRPHAQQRLRLRRAGARGVRRAGRLGREVRPAGRPAPGARGKRVRPGHHRRNVREQLRELLPQRARGLQPERLAAGQGELFQARGAAPHLAAQPVRPRGGPAQRVPRQPVPAAGVHALLRGRLPAVGRPGLAAGHPVLPAHHGRGAALHHGGRPHRGRHHHLPQRRHDGLVRRRLQRLAAPGAPYRLRRRQRVPPGDGRQQHRHRRGERRLRLVGARQCHPAHHAAPGRADLFDVPRADGHRAGPRLGPLHVQRGPPPEADGRPRQRDDAHRGPLQHHALPLADRRRALLPGNGAPHGRPRRLPELQLQLRPAAPAPSPRHGSLRGRRRTAL